MVSGKNIVVAASVTAAVAGLGYIAYFDYKRRNDRQFRRKLKRDRKKAEKTATKIATNNNNSNGNGDGPSLDDISDQALELLNAVAKEKLPESPEEKEQFFMAQVSKGEALCGSGAAGYAEAACRFFQALKVYPNPVELVMIYQKTTPDMVFKLVMAMMAQEVRQKQARYFDVFPAPDMNVRIKDKNKADEDKSTADKGKKAGKDGDNKSDVVVPNRALFATKDIEDGEIIYEEESVVSTLLPCAQNGQFCYHCLRAIPEKAEEVEEVEAEEVEAEKSEEVEETEETKEETEKVEETEKSEETKKEPGSYAEAAEKGLSPQIPSKSSGALECTSCHTAVYCSEKCRQDSYDAYHQFLCPTSSSSTAREFAVLTQKSHELAPILIAKFFGILVDREKKKELARALGVGEGAADEYTTWEHLECMRYLELVPTANDAAMLHKLGELMSASVPGLNEFVTGERYTMLKGKLGFNAYAVHAVRGSAVPQESEETRVSDTARDAHAGRSVGIALYLVSSHISHACDPNVEITFPDHTDRAAVRALRAIAEGEELRISYVDPTLGVEARKQKLQSLYRISCTCDKCEAESSLARADGDGDNGGSAVPEVSTKTIDPADEGTPSFAAVAATPTPEAAAAAFEANVEKAEEASEAQAQPKAEAEEASETQEQTEAEAEKAPEAQVQPDAEVVSVSSDE